METVLLLRNGEQLLLALVIPVLVLIGGVLAARQLDLSLSHTAIDELTPGVLALAIMSTSFTSLAIATGFERRYGVLKRLGASPLPRHGLLLGKVGACCSSRRSRSSCSSAVALLWAGPRDHRARPRRRAGDGRARAPPPSPPSGCSSPGPCGPRPRWPRRTSSTSCSPPAAASCCRRRRTAGSARSSACLPSGALGSGMRECLLHGTFPLDQSLVLLVWAVVGDRADRQDVQVGVT